MDPDENQVNNPEHQVQDVAEPVEPQWEAKDTPMPQSGEKSKSKDDAPSDASAKTDEAAAQPVDEVEWPSLDEAGPQRRRRSKESIKRIKRRRRIRTLLIVLLVIGAVAAAGWGFVNHSVNQGKRRLRKDRKGH
ncbi:MAG: hypothetical protein ACLS3M_06970 [Collinsella sp.]